MAIKTDIRLSVDTLHALNVLRDHELERLELKIEFRERFINHTEYSKSIAKLEASKRRAKKIFDERLNSDLVASALRLEIALQRSTLPKKKTRRAR